MVLSSFETTNEIQRRVYRELAKRKCRGNAEVRSLVVAHGRRMTKTRVTRSFRGVSDIFEKQSPPVSVEHVRQRVVHATRLNHALRRRL